jgi:nucleoside-diphosphate-sugar epimerase
MKVLITGANGFLGSHIVKYFLTKNESIYGISLHSNRLNGILNQIQFKSCDINNIKNIEREISNFSPEVVIHCAWDGGNNFLETQSSLQFHNNLPGLACLMEIIKKNKVSHFVGIGSGSEYGNVDSIITESTIESPINLYGTCKLMAKLYTERFCKTENIMWTWVRPFYIYGPNDVQNRLITKTITSCLKNEEMNLNNCEFIVDYLYINDFVDAIHKLILFRTEGIFNVCSGIPYQVKFIVEKIHSMIGNKNLINFGAIPERDNHPSKILGSNQKLIKAIDKWIPTIHIDEGLLDVINYYKNI